MESQNQLKYDYLVIPIDTGRHSIDFNIQEIKEVLGTIDETKAGNIKSFLYDLFQLGGNLNYSHEDYKTAIALCFRGKLREQYLAMSQEKLEDIVRWFESVYHKPNSVSVLTKKLHSLNRWAREPISNFMERYNLIAKFLDKMKDDINPLWKWKTISTFWENKVFTNQQLMIIKYFW